MTHRSTFVVLFLAIVAVSVGAQSPAVQPEIDRIGKEIGAAEAETEKLAGGLVKALIESRIATLRQTKAMLDQRKAAADFNIAVRYTADGKTFTPPANAKDELANLAREVEGTKLRIAAGENEVSKYSGGLVLAMAMSTLATLRQTEAMLDQKRLALLYGLPQFVGFAGRRILRAYTNRETNRRSRRRGARNDHLGHHGSELWSHRAELNLVEVRLEGRRAQ